MSACILRHNVPSGDPLQRHFLRHSLDFTPLSGGVATNGTVEDRSAKVDVLRATTPEELRLYSMTRGQK